MRIMHIRRTADSSCDKFKDSEFRILLSSLFYSITVDRKKEFRKYSCLTLNNWMLLWFLVISVDKTLEVISKRLRDARFFKLNKQARFSVPSP